MKPLHGKRDCCELRIVNKSVQESLTYYPSTRKPIILRLRIRINLNLNEVALPLTSILYSPNSISGSMSMGSHVEPHSIPSQHIDAWPLILLADHSYPYPSCVSYIFDLKVFQVANPSKKVTASSWYQIHFKYIVIKASNFVSALHFPLTRRFPQGFPGFN
jgi:hypothetical protein